MTEPTNAHVEAVAMCLSIANRNGNVGLGIHDLPNWRWAGLPLLTSTDSNVLDAMQDALVRAGRLTEEAASPDPIPITKVLRTRLVTAWGVQE
jgi:hypothetical protein